MWVGVHLEPTALVMDIVELSLHDQKTGKADVRQRLSG